MATTQGGPRFRSRRPRRSGVASQVQGCDFVGKRRRPGLPHRAGTREVEAGGRRGAAVGRWPTNRGPPEATPQGGGGGGGPLAGTPAPDRSTPENQQLSRGPRPHENPCPPDRFARSYGPLRGRAARTRSSKNPPGPRPPSPARDHDAGQVQTVPQRENSAERSGGGGTRSTKVSQGPGGRGAGTPRSHRGTGRPVTVATMTPMGAGPRQTNGPPQAGKSGERDVGWASTHAPFGPPRNVSAGGLARRLSLTQQGPLNRPGPTCPGIASHGLKGTGTSHGHCEVEGPHRARGGPS